MDIAEYFRYVLGIHKGPGCYDNEQWISAEELMVILAITVAPKGMHSAGF